VRPTLPLSTLATYCGQYGESIQVALDGGTLRLCWGGRRRHALVPLGKNEFEADHGTQRVQFVMEDGQARELVWRLQSGEEWKLARVAK